MGFSRSTYLEKSSIAFALVDAEKPEVWVFILFGIGQTDVLLAALIFRFLFWSISILS